MLYITKILNMFFITFYLKDLEIKPFKINTSKIHCFVKKNFIYELNYIKSINKL